MLRVSETGTFGVGGMVRPPCLGDGLPDHCPAWGCATLAERGRSVCTLVQPTTLTTVLITRRERICANRVPRRSTSAPENVPAVSAPARSRSVYCVVEIQIFCNIRHSLRRATQVVFVPTSLFFAGETCGITSSAL